MVRLYRLMRGSNYLVGFPNRSPYFYSADRAAPFTPLPICMEHLSESARKAPARRTLCVNSSRTQILRDLDVHLSHHELPEQAQLVAEGKLDLAAYVIQEDAEFLHTVIGQYGLDIVSPQNLRGLVERYPWLSLGHISAGRYNLVRPTPAADKQIAQLGTLVIASPCAQRADRIALLMLLGAELPGFVRGNPPNSTSPATILPLARWLRLGRKP